MAGRPKDPNAPYRVVQHNANGYQYGAVVKRTVSKKSGKPNYNYIHLGRLDDALMFHPNLKFRLLPLEERRKYTFPEEWDIHEVTEGFPDDSKPETNPVPGDVSPSTPPNTNPDHTQSSDGILPDSTPTPNPTPVPGSPDNAESIVEQLTRNPVVDKFYGSHWFLLEIAKKLNVVQDLRKIIGDAEITNEVLSLAVYPYLTGGRSFSRFQNWQRSFMTYTDRIMAPPYITRLTEHLNNRFRSPFIAQRLSRHRDEKMVVCCDSTSVSAWGECLINIRWGYNKDNPTLKNTIEVVVYSITSHEPLYYRTFAGNKSDLTTVRTILAELAQYGITNAVIIFDRGYESEDNIQELIQRDFPFIMCAKTCTAPVYDQLRKIKYNVLNVPVGMEFNEKRDIHYGQYPVSGYKRTRKDGTEEAVSELKVNLYLDDRRRTHELSVINEILRQDKVVLDEINELTKLSDAEVKQINGKLKYHTVRYSARKGIVSKTAKMLERDIVTAGYFASLAYKEEGDAWDQHLLYKLRDEQEKYFYLMKIQDEQDTQKCSNESAREGRMFIAFVGLILISWVNNTWDQSEILKKKYTSSLDVLDIMGTIRMLIFPDGTTHMETFNEEQIIICEEFGIDVPLDCMTTPQKERSEKRLQAKKNNQTGVADTEAATGEGVTP